MTPNDIEVLIHHHVSGTIHPRATAPAVNEAICRFVHDDILRVDGAHLTTTPRGAALVRALCRTPYPTIQWVDEHGKVL